MHASVRAISASFSAMRASFARIRPTCACISAMASARHCRTAATNGAISRGRSSANAPAANSRLPSSIASSMIAWSNLRLGLAQELVYIIGHHDRCRRSLPGGPGGPFNVFSQSLSLPLKPASTAT